MKISDMIEGLLTIQEKYGDLGNDEEDLHTKLFGESRPWKKVWKIDREYKTWDCAMCKGEGVVNAKINELNTAVRCPSCNGKGTKSMPVHYPIVEKGILMEDIFTSLRDKFDSDDPYLPAGSVLYDECMDEIFLLMRYIVNGSMCVVTHDGTSVDRD